MIFGKKKKAKQALDESWRSMEMSCENNYKDLAQEGLKEFEELLAEYYREDLISEKEYRRRTAALLAKKEELRGYNHKQHIGW